MQQQHLLQQHGTFSTRQVRRMLVRAGAAKPRLVPSTTRQQLIAPAKQPTTTQQHAVEEYQAGPSCRSEVSSTRWTMPSWLAGGPGTTLLSVVAAGAAGVLGRCVASHSSSSNRRSVSNLLLASCLCQQMCSQLTCSAVQPGHSMPRPCMAHELCLPTGSVAQDMSLAVPASV
jgi:hypothetical protein